MMRKYRKFSVLVLSLALAMCSPISAAAEEPGEDSSVGSGQMAKVKKQDVYQVLLPTDVNGVFDFMIDPQKLIEETNAAAYGGKSFEKGATVFFHRMDGRSAEEYSSSSDHMTIVNRSTVPVDVMVNVSVSRGSLGGIKMTGDRTFSNDSGASLYMALTDGVNTVPVGTGDSWIRATIPAAPEQAFEYSYDQERGEYHRGLKRDVNGIQFPEYSFQLIGAANEKGDWSELGNAAPLVNVTWKVTPGQSLNSGGEDGTDGNIDPERSDILTQILETEPVDQGIVDGDAVHGREPVSNEAADPDKNPVQDENAVSDRAPVQNGNTDPDRAPVQNESADLDRAPAQNENTDLDRDAEQNKNTDSGKDAAQNENTDSNKASVQNENADSGEIPAQNGNADSGRK